MADISSPGVGTGPSRSASVAAFRLNLANVDIAFIGAMAVVVGLWLPLSIVSISGWLEPMVPIGLLGLIAVMYSRYRPAPALAEMAVFGAKWIAFTTLGIALTYLGASIGLPLMDSEFVRWDRALGFDWIEWVNAIATLPAAGGALALAYDSLLLQIALSIVLLAAARTPGRNKELLLGATISLLITTLIASLTPAMGPWIYFEHGITSPEQIAYAKDVMALRSGHSVDFEIKNMEGILCFPSYHTVLAVLITFAHRRSRYFAAFAAANIWMVLSIPSQGGHYFVDMVAGVAVAVIALLIVRTLVVALKPPGESQSFNKKF